MEHSYKDYEEKCQEFNIHKVCMLHNTVDMIQLKHHRFFTKKSFLFKLFILKFIQNIFN